MNKTHWKKTFNKDYLGAWDIEEGTERMLAGIASGRVLHKPYQDLPWLYIDEVDTAAENQRNREAGFRGSAVQRAVRYGG